MRLKINKGLLSVFLVAMPAVVFVGCSSEDKKDNSIPSSSDVAPQFYSVVTFGDSMSDSGSIKYLTQQFAGDTSPILKRSVPIEPAGDKSGYYSGRFSNGYNWLDRFVTTLDLQMQDPDTCFLRGSNSSCDYAVGGATTDEGLSSDTDPMKRIKDLFKNDFVDNILNSFKIPQHVGIKQMATTYLDISQPSPDVMNHTLYVIWGGGNDYFANADTASTVNNLISSIKSILDYSPDNQVRYFLIPNLPDLSKTPYGADPAHVGLNLAEKTAAHNSLLQQQIASEITSNPQYKPILALIYVHHTI